MRPETDPDREKLLREKELAFFGAVTASISHELNNAMAIIEQTAGLLEDLIVGSSGTRPIPTDQLRKIADRIANQTKRGATIVRRLNAFAHSVDDREKEFHLDDLMTDVAQLAHRMAHRKQVRLETHTGGVPVIRSSPFRVRQALYLSIQHAVSAAVAGETVDLSTGRQGSRVWISIESRPSDPPEPPPDVSHLEILMEELGGSLETTLSAESLSIRLLLPAPSPG